LAAIEQFIFFCGLILSLSVLAGAISNRGSTPVLLIFLGIGMFFGEDGPGNIVFYNIELSYLVCSIALAVILFDGGLNTSMRQFKIGLRPAASLASIGVIITASIIGLILSSLTEISFISSLLIGATVASTDAAAVFMLLHQQKISLRPRVVAALETESGINDPIAVLMTVTIVQFILDQNGSDIGSILFFFIKQLLIGVAIGYAGGWAMTRIMNHDYVPEGLKHIFCLSGTLMIFGGAAMLHGSGFIAVYLAGLIAGNKMLSKRKESKIELAKFLDSMAWLSQIIMLLILGLLVTPSRMMQDFPEALLVACVLIFIARPVAVFIALYFSRMKLNEKMFISWVGLRGAVPIYLALIPFLMGVENSVIFFNIAFATVVLSLLLQGTTIKYIATYLKLHRDNTNA